MLKVKIFAFVLCFLSLKSGLASANLIIFGNNVTRSFDDIGANFGSPMKESGEYGKLYLAEPLNACSKLINKVNVTGKDTMLMLPFALIIKGVCSFETKVRKAQQAGFKAAIIFDNVDGDPIAIGGNSYGIKIQAMLVSKMYGELLVMFVGDREVEVLLLPNFNKNSKWSIIVISFLSMLLMFAVFVACFTVSIITRGERPHRTYNIGVQFHGMSSYLVNAMPSVIFTSVLDDRGTSITCAICLEDYTVGEKLRILPCFHKFHAACVDTWLTTRRTLCPVCKRDARTSSRDLPPSEWIPLLPVSSPVSIPISSSSFQSSLIPST